MTDLLDRSATSRPHDATDRPRSVMLSAAGSATWAAAMGMVPVTVVVVLVWAATSGSTASAGDAVRTAANLWLLAQHVGITLPSGHLGLVPLGLSILPAGLLYRAGLSVGRVTHVRTLTDAWLAAAALAATYAVLAGLVAGLASFSSFRPAPVQALVAAWGFAFGCGGAGLLRHDGLGGRLLRRLPDVVRSSMGAGLAAAAAIIGVAALTGGVALAAHHAEATQLASALRPGVLGGGALFLLDLVLLPNAVAWAAAYLVGPGFAVGSGTALSPYGHHAGAVPAVPLLAALPSGAAPAWAPALTLVPVLAGLSAGWLLHRRTGPSVWWRPLLAAAGAAATAGAVLALFAGLAGGPAGPGLLATVGPSAWQVGLLTTAEIGVPAALVVAVAGVLSRRGHA